MQTDRLWVGSDKQFFSLLTKVVFVTGFSRMVVERRWEAFRAAFADFSPADVAQFDEVTIERLLSRESLIIRNARKVRATVVNAAVCVELAGAHRSLQEFSAHTGALGRDVACRVLRKTFSAVGDSAANTLWNTLYGDGGFREVSSDYPDFSRLAPPGNRFL